MDSRIQQEIYSNNHNLNIQSGNFSKSVKRIGETWRYNLSFIINTSEDSTPVETKEVAGSRKNWKALSRNLELNFQ